MSELASWRFGKIPGLCSPHLPFFRSSCRPPAFCLLSPTFHFLSVLSKFASFQAAEKLGPRFAGNVTLRHTHVTPSIAHAHAQYCHLLACSSSLAKCKPSFSTAIPPNKLTYHIHTLALGTKVDTLLNWTGLHTQCTVHSTGLN